MAIRADASDYVGPGSDDLTLVESFHYEVTVML